MMRRARSDRRRVSDCWPAAYGVFGGLLMVLFFVLFVVPVMFFALWSESGNASAAWRILWDMDESPTLR